MAKRAKPTKASGGCPLCGKSLRADYSGDAATTYPGLVCRKCDDRAVDAAGAEPHHSSEFDGGANPVFIDGKKCWRRYRFGGFVTMYDPDDCPTLEDFHARHFG